MEFWATIAEGVISKQPARFLNAAGAPWSFSRRALWTRPDLQVGILCLSIILCLHDELWNARGIRPEVLDHSGDEGNTP